MARICAQCVGLEMHNQTLWSRGFPWDSEVVGEVGLLQLWRIVGKTLT